MHSRGKHMLSLARGNIFGNNGIQNKEIRIYFMVHYLSFLFPEKSSVCRYELISVLSLQI